MILLLLHLYVYLPFYTSKQDPILFKCVLGEEIIKNIELNNPTQKDVLYTAKYEGSDDFTLLSEEEFRI